MLALPRHLLPGVLGTVVLLAAVAKSATGPQEGLPAGSHGPRAQARALQQPIQCSATELQQPTFHFFNTRTVCHCTPQPCSCGVMGPLNDANAIFEHHGVFHVMLQKGGGNWSHGVAHTAAGPWFPLQDALGRSSSTDLPWDSHQGPCDGTLSFPDLGTAPFNGSAPVILYGPDCNEPLNRSTPGLSAELGDAPRVEVALPEDPSDPLLRLWRKQRPGPVIFEGTPCSFPGNVWRSPASQGDSDSSTGGGVWNMICSMNGHGPWARYTSSTPTLMTWKLADEYFTVSAETGLPQRTRAQSGAFFHPIPNPKPGGPTHMINGGTVGPMLLGTYDNVTEKFRINNTLGGQILDGSPDFRWGAVGKASEAAPSSLDRRSPRTPKDWAVRLAWAPRELWAVQS